MTEEKEKQTDRYVVKEVVTATDFAVGTTDSEEIFNDKTLAAEILNKLDRIETVIGKA